MTHRVVNQGQGVLTADLVPGQVTIQFTSTTIPGSDFHAGGSDVLPLSLVSLNGAGVQVAREVVYLTDFGGGVGTVLRGQEGTPILYHPAGTLILAPLTASHLLALIAEQQGFIPQQLTPGATPNQPPGGYHVVGELYLDSNSQLCVCLTAGTVGTWKNLGLIDASQVVSGVFPTARLPVGVANGLATLDGNVRLAQSLQDAQLYGRLRSLCPNVPTVAAGAGAGTSPPAPQLVSGSNDVAGEILFGTGTTPLGNPSPLFTLTFGNPALHTGNYIVDLTFNFPENGTKVLTVTGRTSALFKVCSGAALLASQAVNHGYSAIYQITDLS